MALTALITSSSLSSLSSFSSLSSLSSLFLYLLYLLYLRGIFVHIINILFIVLTMPIISVIRNIIIFNDICIIYIEYCHHNNQWRRPGPVHPDLPVGPVVRRRDRLHVPGQPDGVPLLPSRATRRRVRAPFGKPAAARLRCPVVSTPGLLCPTKRGRATSKGSSGWAARPGAGSGGGGLGEPGARPPGRERRSAGRPH